MKVAKEEIMGLVAALEIFADEDEEAETKRYREMMQRVVDALIEVPGLHVRVEHDEWDYLVPYAVIDFTSQWRGRPRDEVLQSLNTGSPGIHLSILGDPDQLAVEPTNLDDQELEIVIRRLREELLK